MRLEIALIATKIKYMYIKTTATIPSYEFTCWTEKK
jgi:hypothetical protein